MSKIVVENISIDGISATVPKDIQINNDKKFISLTGIQQRRISNEDQCSSDLCYHSAEKIISDLNIDREEIEILIFVSQTSDYKLPSTSNILQNKLKLNRKCICMDISLGCSGYVYGLFLISSLINLHKLKKGILLVGDTISKEINQFDESTKSLFGDAGSATILSYDSQSEPLFFSLGGDGEGSECIIIPNSGSRICSNNLNKLQLNGPDVFNFGVNVIPKIMKDFFTEHNLSSDEIEHFIFHSANKMMNDKINKKLEIPEHKSPTCLKNYGNTSCATIPLTIITELSEIEKNKSIVLCGFGVGLSWATMYTKTNKNIHCSELVQI